MDGGGPSLLSPKPIYTAQDQPDDLDAPLRTPPPLTNTIRIPLQPTSKLVDKATVHLKLLQLFEQWDSDGNSTLSVNEIVWGLRIAGIKCNPVTLARSIYDISFQSGSVNEADLATLKNHEFITFMLLEEQLGGHTPQEQLNYLEIMMKGIKGGGSLESALKRVHAMESKQDIHDHDHDNDTNETKDTTTTRMTTTKPQHISILPVLVPFTSTSSSTSSRHSTTTKNLYFDVNEAKHRTMCSTLCVRFQAWHKTRLLVYFLLWWCLGTTMYVFANRWNFFQGLYYSIQSGFSIGFGSLSEEKQKGIDLYHQCYPTLNDGNTTLIDNLILAKHQQNNANHNSTTISTATESNVGHMLCVYQYDQNDNVALSMLFTVIHICCGAVLIGGILSYFSASSIEASEAWFEEAKDDKYEKDVKEKYQKTQKLRLQWEYTKLWISNHPTSIAAWCLLLLWLCIGALVFEALEGGIPDYPFIKGLYFATSAASTGGLAGPSPNKTGSVAFTCFFCLIGVPLYAFSLGEIANLFTEKYFMLKGIEQRQSAITEKEFAWMNRLGDGDNEIDKCKEKLNCSKLQN